MSAVQSHSRSKEITMPRMLRRAAVLGATARVASRRGQARAGQADQPPDAAAAPPPPPAQDEAPPPAAPAGDPYGDLMRLKELLDAGALTQAEFDTQKQKILSA
jgi:Short C-terminal domain